MTKVLVLGYGVTGQSVCRFLSKRGLAFDVWQSRWSPSVRADFNTRYPEAYCFSETSPPPVAHYDYAVVSPGFAPSHPVVVALTQQRLRIVGDIELFARYCTTPVIAITGTNGKSSVTTMVGLMLQQAGVNAVICGNIGRGVLDVAEAPADVIVMELSSYQLHYQSTLSPKIACLLNITPDHLDWHGDFQAYVAAKQRVFQRAAHAVYYHQQVECRPREAVPKITSFGDSSSAADYTLADGAVLRQGQPVCSLGDLPIDRMLSSNNLLAAIAVVEVYGVPVADTLPALQQYAGLPHRQQCVAEHGGVRWYNDSKATNVHAVLTAIDWLGRHCRGRLIWIAGGRGKGEALTPLLPLVKRHVKFAIFLGEMQQRLSACFADQVETQTVATLADAVAVAAEQASIGDAVLLSPAGASFDMFVDYRARGEAFIRLVDEKCGVLSDPDIINQ